MSHLTRGAWIEILHRIVLIRLYVWSHLTRGAWIEIARQRDIRSQRYGRTSHEVRGLKFRKSVRYFLHIQVAPHTRCVD